MSEITLGQLASQDACRDAMHIAVSPVTAHALLKPGQRVGVTANSDGTHMTNDGDPVGVVDPFLGRDVEAGQRFYLCLFPNSIRGMRHHWLHPLFMTSSTGDADAKESALAVLEHWSKQSGLDLPELIESAENYLDNGEYLCQGERWDGFMLESNFWTAFEIYTGRVVPESERGSFFSCSC